MRIRTPGPWLVSALFAIVALVSCEGPTDPTTDATCVQLLNEPNSADAFEWLATPTAGPKDLGGMTVDQALALAHKFEARRPALVAAGNQIVDRPPNLPVAHSRGLVVELPDDPRSRLAIFRLYAEQIRNHGESAQADTGQKYLFVPWGLGTEHQPE